MSNAKNWALYSIIRLLMFAVPFAVFLALGLQFWLCAVLAAVVGLSLSIIFLAGSRSRASESIYQWRQPKRNADDILEDEAVEAAEAAEAVAPSAEDAATVAEATSDAEAGAESASERDSAAPERDELLGLDADTNADRDPAAR